MHGRLNSPGLMHVSLLQDDDLQTAGGGVMVFLLLWLTCTARGIVDQELYTGHILLNLSGSALVKADLGNAVLKEVDGRPNWLEKIM